jgi:uncharacterized phage infection (PIP) family protein YhgE
MNQEKLLENIGERVARTMKQEFFAEFIEMRRVMGEANQAQREHLAFMENAEKQFQTDVMQGESRMTEAMEASSSVVLSAMAALNEQEQNLSTFVADMRRAMDGIVETSDLNVRMTQQMEHLIDMNDDVADKMMELAQLSERYTKSLASVQAANSDLSEGLAVMNDSNIRMTDQISKMNASTAEVLEASRAAQMEYIAASSEYLKQIQASQDELSAQMKTQQSNLKEFTEYMTQVLSRMTKLTETNSQMVTNLQVRVDKLSQAPSDDLLVQQQLDRMIELLEAQEKRSARQEAAAYAGGEAPKRRGFFSRG